MVYVELNRAPIPHPVYWVLSIASLPTTPSESRVMASDRVRLVWLDHYCYVFVYDST